MQSSQTLRATSPVLLSTSRCSQTPLELSKVLSDSARAFSGALESTWSYGGAFRMLWDLTYRIVKFWSSWDLCADLQKTSREAETAAQLCRILPEQPRWLRSSTGNLVPYYRSSGSYITTRHFFCYSHKIRYIIIWHAFFKSLYIYTYGQAGRRWYSSIIRGAPGHAHWEQRDTPLGGRCGETMELEGREPTINTPPHHLRHPNGFHKNVRFWFEKSRNRVRRYHTTLRWGSTQLCGSKKSWTELVRPQVGKHRVCIFIVW